MSIANAKTRSCNYRGGSRAPGRTVTFRVSIATRSCKKGRISSYINRGRGQKCSGRRPKLPYVSRLYDSRPALSDGASGGLPRATVISGPLRQSTPIANATADHFYQGARLRYRAARISTEIPGKAVPRDRRSRGRQRAASSNLLSRKCPAPIAAL